jgi:hypothetical protein
VDVLSQCCSGSRPPHPDAGVDHDPPGTGTPGARSLDTSHARPVPELRQHQLERVRDQRGSWAVRRLTRRLQLPGAVPVVFIHTPETLGRCGRTEERQVVGSARCTVVLSAVPMTAPFSAQHDQLGLGTSNATRAGVAPSRRRRERPSQPVGPAPMVEQSHRSRGRHPADPAVGVKSARSWAIAARACPPDRPRPWPRSQPGARGPAAAGDPQLAAAPDPYVRSRRALHLGLLRILPGQARRRWAGPAHLGDRVTVPVSQLLCAI